MVLLRDISQIDALHKGTWGNPFPWNLSISENHLSKKLLFEIQILFQNGRSRVSAEKKRTVDNKQGYLRTFRI